MLGQVMGLVGLLGDMGASAAIQQEFEIDPEAVGARYGLAAHEIEALQSGDDEKLRECMSMMQCALTNGTIKAYYK
jgi:hypothetical protein